MPSVPYSPIPDVTPYVQQPSNRITTEASPGDFGAQVGQAFQGLGQNLDKAGDRLADTAAQMQTVHNNVAVDAAFNQHQDNVDRILHGDPANPQDTGFYGLRGQDALNARPGVLQALEDSRTSIRAGLQNQMQALKFDEDSRRLNMYSTAGIGSHYEQEFNRYATETQSASIDIKARAVANGYNDDNLFQHNLADALRAADAKSALAGGNDDVFADNRMQASQTLYTARAVAMGTANPAAGLAFVRQNASQFDALTLHKLSDEFKGKADAASDNGYVSSLLSRTAPGAPPAAPQGIYDALHGQEHSTATSVSVDGARGEWQIMPATFKQHALPGENIDTPADNETVGHRIIDDLSSRPNVNGDPARIAVGYFSGPQNVSPAGSAQPWIKDTKDGNGTSTSSYVAGVLAKLQGGAGSPGSAPSPRAAALGANGAYPDESALVRQTIADNPDPERQAARLGKLTQALGTLRLATETDRRDLTNSLPDMQASALAGNDITIPTDRINRLLQPAQAAHELEQLNVAVSAGQVFKSVQWGTPDQVNAAYEDLSKGLGPISSMIRNRTLAAATPGTAAPDSDAESPEAYRLRTQVLAQFQKVVQERQGKLATDPAGYVSSQPSVAAALAAVRAAPNDPTAQAAYNNATLAVQTSLGVPENQQHLLTLADARTLTNKLTTVDPSKGDMGQALAGVAQQYGSAWPKVFGDLVKLGKLPGDYQVLAAMPDPVARTDFQRALAATSAKGGVAQLKEDVPPAAVQAIDSGLDDSIADFRRTASVPGLSSNVALTATVRDSVKTLAYYYAMQSGDGVAALKKAADAVINSKYDFDGGTMRVPKGMLPAAETATSNLQASLKPGDLAPMAADTQATAPMAAVDTPGMSVEQRQAVTLRAAQRGSWVPNEDDSGLVLVGKLASGAMIQMRRADGSRIELPFKTMIATAAGQTPPPAIDTAPALQ